MFQSLIDRLDRGLDRQIRGECRNGADNTWPATMAPTINLFERIALPAFFSRIQNAYSHALTTERSDRS